MKLIGSEILISPVLSDAADGQSVWIPAMDKACFDTLPEAIEALAS